MSRVALVTGGTRGIGAAIAVALSAAGYRVAANYAGNEEKARAFGEETGIPVFKWDVSSYQACSQGIDQVEGEIGPVEVLVNNAGITRDAMFHKMNPDRHQSERSLQHDTQGLERHARAELRPHREYFLH